MKSFCHIYGQLGQTGDRLPEEMQHLLGLGLVCDTDLGFKQAARHRASLLELQRRGGLVAPNIYPAGLDPSCRDANWWKYSEVECVRLLQIVQERFAELNLGPLVAVNTYTPGNGFVAACRQLGIRYVLGFCAPIVIEDGGWSVAHYGSPLSPYFVSAEDYRKPENPGPRSDPVMMASMELRNPLVCLNHWSEGPWCPLNAQAVDRWLEPTGEPFPFLQLAEDWLRQAELTGAPRFFHINLQYFFAGRCYEHNRRALEWLAEQRDKGRLEVGSLQTWAERMRAAGGFARQTTYWRGEMMGFHVGHRPGSFPDVIVDEGLERQVVWQHPHAVPQRCYDYRKTWNYPAFEPHGTAPASELFAGIEVKSVVRRSEVRRGSPDPAVGRTEGVPVAAGRPSVAERARSGDRRTTPQEDDARSGDRRTTPQEDDARSGDRRTTPQEDDARSGDRRTTPQEDDARSGDRRTTPVADPVPSGDRGTTTECTGETPVPLSLQIEVRIANTGVSRRVPLALWNLLDNCAGPFAVEAPAGWQASVVPHPAGTTGAVLLEGVVPSGLTRLELTVRIAASRPSTHWRCWGRLLEAQTFEYGGQPYTYLVTQAPERFAVTVRSKVGHVRVESLCGIDYEARELPASGLSLQFDGARLAGWHRLWGVRADELEIDGVEEVEAALRRQTAELVQRLAPGLEIPAPGYQLFGNIRDTTRWDRTLARAAGEAELKRIQEWFRQQRPDAGEVVVEVHPGIHLPRGSITKVLGHEFDLVKCASGFGFKEHCVDYPQGWDWGVAGWVQWRHLRVRVDGLQEQSGPFTVHVHAFDPECRGFSQQVHFFNPTERGSEICVVAQWDLPKGVAGRWEPAALCSAPVPEQCRGWKALGVWVVPRGQEKPHDWVAEKSAPGLFSHLWVTRG